MAKKSAKILPPKKHKDWKLIPAKCKKELLQYIQLSEYLEFTFHSNKNST